MRRLWLKQILFVFALMLMVANVVAAAPDSDGGKAVVEQMRPLAKQGQPNAQYNMGVIYDRGYGVEQNYDKARSWYKKAAAQSYAKAAHNLGVMYRKGHGVPVDKKRAVYWFKKAAKLGEPAAQNNLAVMYAQGLGVDKNLRLAVVWMARAAKAGNDSARANLSLLTAQLQSAMIAGNNVNVRSEPTMDAMALTQLDSQAQVVVLDTGDEWSQVLVPAHYIVGWVSNALLGDGKVQVATAGSGAAEAARSAGGTTATAEPATDTTTSSNTRADAQKTVATDLLNVRKQPSRQASVLFQLHRGQQVTVVKARNGWKYVKAANGRRGWVAAYLLIDT